SSPRTSAKRRSAAIGGERALDEAIAHGGRTLWEAGGEPVATAGTTPPQDGAVRVVAVCTPERQRGRGYAGAVTAPRCHGPRATPEPTPYSSSPTWPIR
ncbi:GNAT family N-acetyltransferase, partial [Streptomyces sp.]|uniref:GNAT family N-acetyltransferase n=1 Tax=Streptomyces sp. TaxID=1931 RepID=UPI0039C93D1C